MLASILLTLLLGSSAALAQGPLDSTDDNASSAFCGTTITDEVASVVEKSFKANPVTRDENSGAAATIGVYWHVISTDNTVSGGQIPDNTVQQAMSVLNQNFAYAGLSFAVGGVQRVVNPNWYRTAHNSPQYRQMKSQLHTGNAATLNIYAVGPFTDGYLGYATFPWDYDSDPAQDGVVIDSSTLPGGSQQDLNTGKILVHEVGHWVGLLHTFQGGCAAPGDYVDDTPAEASPASGCPTGRDTCTGGGVDPIHNHMDYSVDVCRTGFTNGQTNRFVNALNQFRGIR